MKGLFIIVAVLALAYASSHSEAPGTASSPRSDIADVYIFNSYEPNRAGFVTMLMTVNGLQDPIGGPNYFPLPSDFVFNIHIDNSGDAVEDITFQFVPGANFSGAFDVTKGTHAGLAIPVPINPRNSSVLQRNVKVALAHIGQVRPGAEDALNYKEHYQMRVYRGAATDNRDIDVGPFATNSNTGDRLFRKPFDNAGQKTFPNGYRNYSQTFTFPFTFPGCTIPGKVHVGQQNDPFSINLGQVFDLINLIPAEELVPASQQPVQQSKFNTLARKSVTAFSLEVHSSCLTGSSPNGVIGAWGSVQYLKHVGPTHRHMAGAQKNRLGNPLINELFIGLTEKDYWNYQHPRKESYFLQYYEYPTLPELVEVLFGAVVRAAVPAINVSLAPNVYPRADLRTVLLQGIPNVNSQELVGPTQCDVVTAPPLADMIRLNTKIAATVRDQQNFLGIIGGDNAGYPNGRRPGDDIVDIFLRVGMGRLCYPPFAGLFCNPSDAPIGNFALTDRAPLDARKFPDTFPYLNTATPGSLLPSDPLPADF